MKKILTLFMISFIFMGYSQLGIGNDTQKVNIVAFPTTANAYALDKVGKLPIDLFKGKANINVPIYNIQSDGINIPISISYNTGGIKLNEVAGIVGLGWALTIPNNITQNIVDKDDKYSNFSTKDINFANQNIRDVGVYDNDIRPYIEQLYAGGFDTKPDIFNYNLPNINGSFIVNNSLGYTIPHNDIKIETFNEIRNVKITDTQGNVFYLTPKNITSVDNGESGLVSANESLYSIDSIRTNSNKKIEFIYGKTLGYNEKNIIERANILISQKPAIGVYETTSPLPNYERYVGSNSNSEKLLTQIIFPDGEINFQYSDDNNLKVIGSETYRKDLNSSAGIALRKVIVKNKTGKIIKDMNFNYSYFESTSVNKTYQDYRLKLVELKDNLQDNSYLFTYDESSPLPARNSNNDDYWGYINSLNNTEAGTGLPQKVYTDYTSQDISIPNSRNRQVNPLYSQLGILTRIDYPTKGSKRLYYESNKAFIPNTTYDDNYSESLASVVSKYPGDNLPDNTADIDTYINIPPDMLYGKTNARLQIAFGNSCQNNNDDINTIQETSCYGSTVYRGNIYGSNGKPKQFVVQSPTVEPIHVMLNRIGNCRCSYSFSILSRKYNTTDIEIPLGGLRIKKIEDINESNVANVLNYKYQYLDSLTNTYKESGILSQPFQFTYLRKNHLRRMDEYGNEVTGDPYIEKYLVVSNSSGGYNTYGSSDIVTYSQVTEFNDLGSTTNVFTQNRPFHRLYSHVYSDYNNWKSGLLKRTAVLSKLNDTLNVQDFKYDIKTLKNSLAGYTSLNSKDIAFALNLDIIKYKKQLSPSMPLEAELYDVNKEYIAIESGKIENIESKTTEYFQNNKIKTVIKKVYSDTDINKPINLESSESIMSSGEKIKTTYAYAHEKNNQLMIDKNMIGIPLETTTTQTLGNVTKTIDKSETIYPTSLPTTQTGNLVLPLSEQSYDKLNNNASTDVSYDKYDEKGNILQYTTKDGVPVSIVWGYNKTQPIAKIEGIAYDQLTGGVSIAGIVSASNDDAVDPTKEGLLLEALNSFRKESALAGKKITTYTYDPLIGVTSITPPSGIRQTFVYDAANRLKETDIRGKNNSGTYINKKISEHNYNYKH